MTDDKHVTQKNLPPEAQRALAEASERRTQQAAKEAELEAARANEKGGPKNVEPIRYGDWERNGIAYDF